MAQEIIPIGTNKILVRLDEARRALAEARLLYEVKQVRDASKAMADFFHQQQMSEDAVFDALELKLLAERKLGEILNKDIQHQGGAPKKHSLRARVLPDEISWSQSSRWQRLAKLQEDLFQEYLRRCRECHEEPTTRGALKVLRSQEEGHRNTLLLLGETSFVNQLMKFAMKNTKKFSTIYADPPWPYDNQGTRAAANRHYPNLLLEEILAMPIGTLAAEQAHLHLWVPNAFLYEAKDIMTEWGFDYKGMFIWCKPNYGLGNYWRVAHELLLLGVRGKLAFQDRGQRSWGEYLRTKHSTKPDEIRHIIEKVSPPEYLELFGRKQVVGWTVVGNEAG